MYSNLKILTLYLKVSISEFVFVKFENAWLQVTAIWDIKCPKSTITNTSFTNIFRQCRTCQKLLENDSDGTSSSFAFVTIDNFWSSSIKGLPWTFQRRSISQHRVCCLKCSARKRWYLSLSSSCYSFELKLKEWMVKVVPIMVRCKYMYC